MLIGDGFRASGEAPTWGGDVSDMGLRAIRDMTYRLVWLFSTFRSSIGY